MMAIPLIILMWVIVVIGILLAMRGATRTTPTHWIPCKSNTDEPTLCRDCFCECPHTAGARAACSALKISQTPNLATILTGGEDPE